MSDHQEATESAGESAEQGTAVPPTEPAAELAAGDGSSLDLDEIAVEFDRIEHDLAALDDESTASEHDADRHEVDPA